MIVRQPRYTLLNRIALAINARVSSRILVQEVLITCCGGGHTRGPDRIFLEGLRM
jgi:hypothetical protein